MQHHGATWIEWLALACASIAIAILVTYLVRRPAFTLATKLWLLFGLFVFPIATALFANVSGFQATQSRAFCGSCHVMEPHANDSSDPNSTSLAGIHARSRSFGGSNCYNCHQDYGMYGFVVTKLGGMRHVALYLKDFRNVPLERAKHEIRILRPLPNANCVSCHTMTAPRWLQKADHASSLADLRSGQVSCASPGCHGFAHPVTKLGKELLEDGGLPRDAMPAPAADGGHP